MKKIILSIVLLLCLLLIGCTGTRTRDEAYVGEKACFENGVEFQLICFEETRVLRGRLLKYHSDEGNKFILITFEVVNNSNVTLHLDSSDVYILYGDTKIKQSDKVFGMDIGFYSIKQSQTTKMMYQAVFQVGEDVNASDFDVVISNGKFFGNDYVRFNLCNRPTTDSTQ